MEESVDTEIICFSSGLHLTLVTGPECPRPFAKKVNWFKPAMEYTKISFVSVPKTKKRPEGLT